MARPAAEVSPRRDDLQIHTAALKLQRASADLCFTHKLLLLW